MERVWKIESLGQGKVQLIMIHDWINEAQASLILNSLPPEELSTSFRSSLGKTKIKNSFPTLTFVEVD